MGLVWLPNGSRGDEDTARMQWAGIPFRNRYSSTSAPKSLVQQMRGVDDLLDLKFYIPTECWHVVRYIGNRDGEFTRCWACDGTRGTHKELGSWIIDALHAGDTRNRDVIKEIDASNDALQKSMDNEKEAQAREFADDLRKPLQALYDGAPDTHYCFAVGEEKVEKKEGFTIKDNRCTSTN